MKSRNLNFLEPPGPLQACNGIALPYTGWQRKGSHVNGINLFWVLKGVGWIQLARDKKNCRVLIDVKFAIK